MSVRCAVISVLLWGVIFALFPQTLSASAAEKVLQKDTDGDGRIDQAAHVCDRLGLILLEIDSNADGRFDRFQHYTKEEVTKIERDRNHDGKIDARDFFEKGKRVRHEGLRPETVWVEVIILR